MMNTIIMILFALCSATLPAIAETKGNDLLDECQTAVRTVDNNGAPAGEQFEAGWCIGWTSAALQLTALHNDWSNFTQQKPALLQFCLPESGIPAIQAVRILVKYLKEHPEQLHEDGMSLTIAALKESFPCKPKTP